MSLRNAALSGLARVYRGFPFSASSALEVSCRRWQSIIATVRQSTVYSTTHPRISKLFPTTRSPWYFQPGAAQLKHGSRGRSESHYHRRAEVGAIAVPVCWTVAVQVRPVNLKCFASLGACRAATATIFATFGYALAGFVAISFPLRSLSKPSVHYC